MTFEAAVKHGVSPGAVALLEHAYAVAVSDYCSTQAEIDALEQAIGDD